MAITYAEQEREGLYAGIDMGGTKIQAALIRVSKKEGGGFVHAAEAVSQKVKYHEIWQVDLGKKMPDAEKCALLTGGIASLLHKLFDEAGAPDAIGVASAGFTEGRTIREAQNIGIQKYDVCDALENAFEVPTVLMKDSWAPVQALELGEPAIVFSLGTGFGGVSCQGDRSIPLLSYTENTRMLWVPCLMANDDPGYACCFTPEECRVLIEKSAAIAEWKGHADADDLTKKLWAMAKSEGKATPGGVASVGVRFLAPKMASRLKKDGVFADFFGAASFVLKVREILGAKPLAERELDAALKSDPQTRFAFALHAGFVAAILNEMQHERDNNGLLPAGPFYGAGGGFNEANEKDLGGLILAHDWPNPQFRPKGPIKTLKSPLAEATVACYGAALGAARMESPPAGKG